MKNIEIIKNIFEKENVYEVGFCSLNDLVFQKDHLLNNRDLYKSCIVFCIPYLAKDNNPKNLSKYAAVLDYHYFFKTLMDKIIPSLKSSFPNDDFIGFSDHSPINERDAAIKSKLGILGKNSMIINKRYGSYFFLGEIFTTLETENVRYQPVYCNECNKCVVSCPTGAIKGDFSKCLSHITQKKIKTKSDIEVIQSNYSVWGCDICQDVCPYNKGVEYSPIEFFEKSIILSLDSDKIENMSDEDFSMRAFSWRGKKTILENISFFNE